MPMYYFRPFKFFPSKDEEEAQADILLYSVLTLLTIVLIGAFVVVPVLHYMGILVATTP